MKRRDCFFARPGFSLAGSERSSPAEDAFGTSRASGSSGRQRGERGRVFLVAMAEGPHPIPSRTRSLSLPAPMVLQGRPCGRVGRRQIYGPLGNEGAFLFGSHANGAARCLAPMAAAWSSSAGNEPTRQVVGLDCPVMLAGIGAPTRCKARVQGRRGAPGTR